MKIHFNCEATYMSYKNLFDDIFLESKCILFCDWDDLPLNDLVPKSDVYYFCEFILT